jgi:hypothetical protein
MCSVSFLRRGGGFHLLMNRDEQRSRPAALPPEICPCGDGKALYPRETGGGTWIGINDAGLAFALINWYARPGISQAISRGLIIPALLEAKSAGAAGLRLNRLPLERMNPFRLMIFSVRERSLWEWRSDRAQLDGKCLSWRRRHWFSSGFDEARANLLRARTCRVLETETASPASLRRLHRSHHPRPGAFSICMHRTDACTVSCTELEVTENSATMRYHAGPPCRRAADFARTLRFEKSALAL